MVGLAKPRALHKLSFDGMSVAKIDGLRLKPMLAPTYNDIQTQDQTVEVVGF